jgi:hypothetical protein
VAGDGRAADVANFVLVEPAGAVQREFVYSHA